MHTLEVIMKRKYFVKFKKPRCGEQGTYVNDLELVILALNDEILEDCELVMEYGYVIETTVTQCYTAIVHATDNEVWRKCGEEHVCIVVEDK